MTSTRAPRLRAGRTRRLFPFLLVPAIALAMPESAFAAGAGEMTLGAHIARIANFAILAGLLYYFLKSPLVSYLNAQHTQVRQDLVAASAMRATATAELAGIEQRMQKLPAELEALRRQGAEDVAAEQARIKQAAATERERLLETTRREIDMRLRLAQRELTEHAAALAVGIAEQRIRQTITPEDQMRLVDRYTAQLHTPGRAAGSGDAAR
jgi:F-type H+-transporting ATPase subunit b